MDESVDKGMKSLSLKDISDAAIPKSREIGRIFVSGYDTALTRDVVESALRKHFASCGEITDVYIPSNFKKDARIWQNALIYFVGEGAVDKALQLKGSDVDGWTVSVTAYPFSKNANSIGDVRVEGYDPSLSHDEILSAMTKLFSSYGKISPVIFSDRSVILRIQGKDAAEKVPELNGILIEGRKLDVRLLSGLNKSTRHQRRLRGGLICGRRYFQGKKKFKTSDEL
ncbi:PREDICTED: uncharacterized protein LOC104708485 [Camelina sativa]|uniref:Uncharacterized protein LOC104708485 n=1 Tax=Camelina sativa TaxID=90675 RepID=A0ABM0TAM7_CAMSA|nr:PREDICTED: uncharacterized protein LOC104708485 [Camelina sativa]